MLAPLFCKTCVPFSTTMLDIVIHTPVFKQTGSLLSLSSLPLRSVLSHKAENGLKTTAYKSIATHSDAIALSYGITVGISQCRYTLSLITHLWTFVMGIYWGWLGFNDTLWYIYCVCEWEGGEACSKNVFAWGKESLFMFVRWDVYDSDCRDNLCVSVLFCVCLCVEHMNSHTHTAWVSVRCLLPGKHTVSLLGSWEGNRKQNESSYRMW